MIGLTSNTKHQLDDIAITILPSSECDDTMSDSIDGSPFRRSDIDTWMISMIVIPSIAICPSPQNRVDTRHWRIFIYLCRSKRAIGCIRDMREIDFATIR